MVFGGWQWSSFCVDESKENKDLVLGVRWRRVYIGKCGTQTQASSCLSMFMYLANSISFTAACLFLKSIYVYDY